MLSPGSSGVPSVGAYLVPPICKILEGNFPASELDHCAPSFEYV